MNWGVLAPLAAVIVTAVLGAVAIAREQSAIRQLERVTIVLKDAESDFDGRQALLWLQTALAERVNRQYRAPRKRSALIYGWATRLAGWGVLLWVYFVFSSVFFRTVLTDEVGQPRVGATWAAVISITVLGFVGSAVGAFHLRKRERERAEWLAHAGPADSEASML